MRSFFKDTVFSVLKSSVNDNDCLENAFLVALALDKDLIQKISKFNWATLDVSSNIPMAAIIDFHRQGVRVGAYDMESGVYQALHSYRDLYENLLRLDKIFDDTLTAGMRLDFPDEYIAIKKNFFADFFNNTKLTYKSMSDWGYEYTEVKKMLQHVMNKYHEQNIKYETVAVDIDRVKAYGEMKEVFKRRAWLRSKTKEQEEIEKLHEENEKLTAELRSSKADLSKYYGEFHRIRNSFYKNLPRETDPASGVIFVMNNEKKGPFCPECAEQGKFTEVIREEHKKTATTIHSYHCFICGKNFLIKNLVNVNSHYTVYPKTIDEKTGLIKISINGEIEEFCPFCAKTDEYPGLFMPDVFIDYADGYGTAYVCKGCNREFIKRYPYPK